MLRNIDINEIVKSNEQSEIWNINIKVDSSYKEKMDFITQYYNDKMEKAPSVTGMFRYVVDATYKQIKESK